jgi:hypothetical protein
MSDEVRAEPDALIGLADACLTAADDLGAHYRAGLRDLVPAAAAFGNTRASAATAGTAQAARAAAESAVRDHVDILEGDADRLLQAAFAYRAADERSGRQFDGSRQAPA